MPIQSTIPLLGAPDYRNWFSVSTEVTDEEKNQTFVHEIIPRLSDYSEGTLLNKTWEETKWLTDFIDPNTGFKATACESENNPNKTTIILADPVEHLAGTVITVAWQKNMAYLVQRFEVSGSEDREGLMQGWELTECREHFVRALPELGRHPLWRVLCARIRMFSLLLGCPSPYEEPLDCITSMLVQISSNASRVGGERSLIQTEALEPAKLRHEDYTVGWICPLEVEQVAALEMLDDEHERLPQSHIDHNVYTLGSIGGHNVVIAALPQTGNNSAAAVVTQARTTFPNLRFGLLVGIGGGVPTTTDNGMIRLGDIVVSKPADQHSGVVQYDHGSAEAGHFRRKGSLAPPPSLLLSAAQGLAAQRARSRNDPILQNMKRIDTSIRGLRKYKYPGPAQDHLYHLDYLHRDSKVSCDQCGCDPAQRVQRPVDNEYDDDDGPCVVVHRGTIASGELVIKNGKLRDELAQQHGILCFEMEAAGAMANFPCIVIRGISDYSDSHKNNQWNGYAAAAAAAYARALFFHMPRERPSSAPLYGQVQQEAVGLRAAPAAGIGGGTRMPSEEAEGVRPAKRQRLLHSCDICA